MRIRAIIVDDEPLARERVRMLLRDEDVEVVAEAEDGLKAVEEVERNKPDLLFLDVQMPGIDGFQVLQKLTHLPVVIFTTAFDQHAVRAFDAHALDYLLKPFKPVRFKEALQRARELIETKKTSAAARGLLNMLAERSSSPAEAYVTRLTVKDGDKVRFISVTDIDTIEAAGNYAVIHVGQENHILRETLTNLEGKLSPRHFMRASRSALVNLERIKELQPMFKGENVIVLKNGRTLPTTRGLREIQQQLETL